MATSVRLRSACVKICRSLSKGAHDGFTDRREAPRRSFRVYERARLRRHNSLALCEEA
jgi:hypothetical protein